MFRKRAEHTQSLYPQQHVHHIPTFEIEQAAAQGETLPRCTASLLIV